MSNHNHNGKKHKPKKYKGKDNKITAKKQQQQRERDNELVERREAASAQNGATHEKRSRRKPRLGRGDSGGLLTDPTYVKQDARLIQRAIRNRWGVRRKGMIRRRLEAIVEHEEVAIITRDGHEISAAAADGLAIAAARALVQMNAQDQTDDLAEAKLNSPNGTSVNVDVNIGGSQILQLAERFGAREVIIDGRAIEVASLTRTPLQAGTVQPEARE